MLFYPDRGCKMNERTFETLELESLINLLAGHCLTTMGGNLAFSLKPSIEIGAVKDALEFTTECVEDRKSTRLNSSHRSLSRMPSSA